LTHWNRLTAKFVETAKPGKYCDGACLYLVVNKRGNKSWVLRFKLPGQKTREKGLGSAKTVTLQQARARAAEGRRLVAEWIDPIEKSNADKIENSRPKPTFPTLHCWHLKAKRQS